MRPSPGLWDPCCSLSPYASRVVDLPASRAVGALELGFTLAADVSGAPGWVLDAGSARLHLDRRLGNDPQDLPLTGDVRMLPLEDPARPEPRRRSVHDMD